MTTLLQCTPTHRTNSDLSAYSNNIYSMVIVQPYELIHWKVVLCMWYRPENRSDIMKRGLILGLGCTTSGRVVLPFSLTVTVSAAEDLQASGKRQ